MKKLIALVMCMLMCVSIVTISASSGSKEEKQNVDTGLVECPESTAAETGDAKEEDEAKTSTAAGKESSIENDDVLFKYAEISIEDSFDLVSAAAFGLYRCAGLFTIELPGMNFEVQTDKEYIHLIDEYMTFGTTTKTHIFDDSDSIGGEISVYISGKFFEETTLHEGPDGTITSLTRDVAPLTGDNETVRVIIRDGERIAGYALICFWNSTEGLDTPVFYSAKVVKAVLFDSIGANVDKVGSSADAALRYPDVTVEEVNMLLDAAEQELVIDANLFDSLVFDW